LRPLRKQAPIHCRRQREARILSVALHRVTTTSGVSPMLFAYARGRTDFRGSSVSTGSF
jgi:hypothetical protein